MSGADFLAAAIAVVQLAHQRNAIVIVNDRADIARLSGADGVHVGQHDLAPAMVRRVFGPGAVVGRSTHTVGELDAAAGEAVDYIAIGPVFGTATKETGHDAVGLAMVRRAAEYRKPVVAIGGITLDNAPSVIEAGAGSVAVISDLMTGGDPAARVRQYVDRLSCV